MYYDSIAQAEQKMHAAINQMKIWHIAATPINYAVTYDYLNKKSIELNIAIEEQIITSKKLDQFFLEEVYRQYVLGQSALNAEFIDDIDSVLIELEDNRKQSTHSTERLVKQLDGNISNLKSTNKRDVFTAIKQIHRTTEKFKVEQLQLVAQLRTSKQSTEVLKNQLDDIKNEIYLDPLTGLYNRQAMMKHWDIWLSDDANKQVTAIMVNIDQFCQMNDKFGSLVGDVLLTKVASKISSYIGDSGLPVRSAADEFLILLPEIELNIAREIAEKIRSSVEKLKFVSSKLGTRLPTLHLNIAINDYNVATSADSIIPEMRNMVSQ